MSAVHYIIDGNKYENSSNALSSSIAVDEETGTSAMSLEKNETEGYYTITYDEEVDLSDLKSAIKQELNEEKGYSLSDDILDFLAVLVDNGENLDNYKSEEELKALYFFYKAEVASLALDIRPEKEMFKNPSKQEGYKNPTNTIDGNQIYGIVRVRREYVKEVNVGGDSSIVLKEYLTYKNYEDFQKIIEGDDDKAKLNLLNNFSIDEEGNLIIARWGYTKVTSKYSYYEGDSETGTKSNEAKAKFEDKDKYNDEEKYSITTFTKVPYKQLIPKHSMPYELLVATMIKSDTVEFAEELAEIVNNNTITVTLQESLSQTDTELVNTYTKTFRTYEWITYELKATKNESKSFTGTSTVSEFQAKSNAANSAEAWVKENNIINPQYSYTTNTNSGGGTWSYSISIVYYGYPYTQKEGGFSSKNAAEEAAQKYLNDRGLQGTINTYKESADITTYSATCTVSGYKQSTIPKEHEQVIFDNGEEYYDETYTMVETITTFAQNNTYKLEVTEVDNWYMFYKRSYEYDDAGEAMEFTASKPADEPFSEYDTEVMKEKPEDKELLKKWEKAETYYESKLEEFSDTYSNWNTTSSTLDSVEFKTDIEQKYTSGYTRNDSIKYQFEETTTEIKLKMHQEEPNENVENWDNIKDSIYVDENCFLQIYDEHTEARHKLTTDYQAFFEMLEQNPKTVVLVDIIKYMMYLYDGVDYGVTSIDLNLFKPREFNLFGTGISPLGCPLTREEFINAAESYNCALSPWAADFYDVCMKEEYNVNPCLAFAWACLETGYGTAVPYNNLFGMAIYNGQTSGTRYSSYADSIEDFCKWVVNVSTEGTTAYVASYNQGQDFAEVNPKFKGTPSQNIYVLFCRYMYLGDTHISPETSFSNPAGHNYYVANGSNWTSGGRIYLYYMYELGGLYEGEYATRCGHLNGSDPTTTQEKADYVEYSVNQRIDIAKDIFGDNCFFGGSGGEFVANDDTTYIRGWYTSSFGKRFTIFNQCVFPGLSGRCNRAAWMSVVSGYSPYESGSDLDVLEHYFANTFSVNTPPNSYFNIYGAKTYAASGFSRNGDYTEQMKEELLKGNQAIIWVSTNGQDNVGYIDRNGHQWTGRFHWMAVLDYRVSEDGEEQIFISCSAGNTGWWPLDIFIGGTTKSGAGYSGTSAVYYMYFVTEN